MSLKGLESVGLSSGEIGVYEALLMYGPMPATAIMLKSGLKRGDCYNKLYELKRRGLIEEFLKLKKKHFRVVDPRKLEEITLNQYQQAQVAKREIEGLLPILLSQYNLTYHKPGIVLFEGEEAQRRILDDSLTAEGDILQFADINTVLSQYPHISREYARKRAQLHKRKRMILADTALARQYATEQNPEITQVRLITHDLPPFSTVMQIYNHKISYFTLKPEGMIGVIIEDRLISMMHRSLFEYMWTTAKIPGSPDQNASAGAQIQP